MGLDINSVGPNGIFVKWEKTLKNYLKLYPEIVKFWYRFILLNIFYIMIEGKLYISLVKDYFDYLTTECEFSLIEEEINGSYFYDVQYRDSSRVISISYENLEDYFLVVIFMLQSGQISNYDDKSKTLHLDRLNAQIIPKINKHEIIKNNEYFLNFQAKDHFERKMLKAAKDLRVCLKHFNKFA